MADKYPVTSAGDRNWSTSGTRCLSPGRTLPKAETIAEIVERADKGPMRQIGRGRQRKAVGTYYSVKSGCSLPWESRNELHDFWRSEVRSDVLSSRAQPHTLRWTLNGRTLRYTPDRVDLLTDDSVEVVEVKNTFDEKKDPHYTFKLEFARVVYNWVGWSFRVVEKAEIEAQPQFDAVRTIQRHRRTTFTTADVNSVNELFAEVQYRTWAELQNALPAGPRTFAMLCAMIVRRLILVDLSGGLTPETVVSINSKWS